MLRGNSHSSTTVAAQPAHSPERQTLRTVCRASLIAACVLAGALLEWMVMNARTGVGLFALAAAGALVLALVALCSRTLRILASEISEMGELVEAAQSERRVGEIKLMKQTLLLDSAPDAIFAIGLAGEIQFWNKSAAKLFEIPSEEALGRNAFDLVFKSGALKLDELARGLVSQPEREVETREETKGGKQLTLQSRLTLVRGFAGEPSQVLVLCRDVTERRAFEARRMRSERLASIGTLAGGIAHDINNALVPILFGAEMLQEDPPAEKRLKYSAQVMRNALRIQQVARQIQLFVGTVAPGRHRVEILRMLNDTEGILRHTFPKTLQIKTALAADLWCVTGEEAQLAQMVMNLCLNARDAMGEYGSLTVTAENTQVDALLASQNPGATIGPHVLISVADTGAGIPADILDKIFDPFFTTKGSKVNGLGLSTVLGIVRAHGGFLTLTTKEGQGTRFQVFLPARAQEAAVAAIPTPKGRGETILIVDDEDGIRHIAKSALEEWGYEVLTAADGSEAVALFVQERSKIKAVLCDMMMPLMDGTTTIKALKKICPEIPVMAMSGLIEDRATTAKAAGAGVLLQKPFSAETLLKTVALFVR